MASVISTGLGYQQSALSGMIRESAEQQKIDAFNKQSEAQSKAQTTQLIGSAAATAMMLLMILI